MLRQGVKAALPNTQEQTQGGWWIEETEKYGLNERTEQNPRKRTKQNEDSYPIRWRIQNTGDKDAQRTDYCKSIREEMKVTQSDFHILLYLSKIKKNPQRTNSEGKKARVQFNDLEHKEKINIQREQNETRIKKKKWGKYRKNLGHFQKCQHLNHMDSKSRRGRARNWKLILKK